MDLAPAISHWQETWGGRARNGLGWLQSATGKSRLVRLHEGVGGLLARWHRPLGVTAERLGGAAGQREGGGAWEHPHGTRGWRRVRGRLSRADMNHGYV